MAARVGPRRRQMRSESAPVKWANFDSLGLKSEQTMVLEKAGVRRDIPEAAKRQKLPFRTHYTETSAMSSVSCY